MSPGEAWRLYHGGGLVGEIEEVERDFPWIHGRLHARPGFEPLRPLFTAWRVALDAEDHPGMERAYQAIRAAVTMTYPDGRPVAEFMLGIEGDEASFRWHDEPFDEE
ncbi:hypothetical protein AWW66_24245 [Micromonospora rosaria]|uniref:Uncharacterized protein n=1 Tax=Micromonospora rosaria TaxID=47874 RepID=A0A136PM00_9ACTN|nr:hypothetical protein [Micromonospora rosaria]KXK59421.1 hypothetical protein AWW66_24245 [Micromonospora rosaria]